MAAPSTISALLLIACCSLVQAQQIPFRQKLPVDAEALKLLESTAHKFQTIGSYESSATATRPLGDGFTGKFSLTYGYASPKFTPSELPVPMLDGISEGLVGIFDSHGKAAPANYLQFHSLAMPGPSVPFSEISWRVTRARIAGTETVQSHSCQVVVVRYEGDRHNPRGELVLYSIDPQTNLIWKLRYREVDQLSKTGQLARWTVIWDSWTENQPPPAWLVDIGKQEGAQERAELVGQKAPEIVGHALSGEPFRLSKLRGSVVVLDFWGTWCGPCSEQMALLEKLNASLTGNRVEIWSVTQDNPDAAKRWISERGHTISTAVVPKGTAFKSYGIDRLPQLVIVDRQGNVFHQWTGLKKESDLAQAIREAARQ